VKCGGLLADLARRVAALEAEYEAKNLTRSTLPISLMAAIVFAPILGCVNIVDGSGQTRIRSGDPERITSPPGYHLDMTDDERFDTENRDLILVRSSVLLRATKVESTTTRTPRTEETVQRVLPYSPGREALEFVSLPFALLWAIAGSNWGHWFAMLNPALNSEAMWKGSHVERITESSPVEPLVDLESQTHRIGIPIEIQFDDLPPHRVVVSAQGADTRVEVLDLVTAPLLRAPTSLRAIMRIEGRGEPSISTLPIQDALGDKIHRAQRFLHDPSSGRYTPTELAAAVLRLSELGFAERASSLRRKSALIFGTEMMAREIAAEHILIARNQRNAGSFTVALENIGAARALDERVRPDWDLLEADVLEKRALEALGAGEYDQARTGLLRATTVDPGRQLRLAPFVTISIEASDRAKERRDARQSREAFLAIERERADAEAALARSDAARRVRPTAAAVASGASVAD
jgi:hypothetical protein